MKEFYTIYEVAEIFAVDWQSVRRMIKSNKINAIKIGGQWRVSFAEVERLKMNGIK